MAVSQGWIDGWQQGWRSEGITGPMYLHLAVWILATALVILVAFLWYRNRRNKQDAMFPDPPPNDGENRPEQP